MPRTLIFILVLFIVGLCGVDARACSCAGDGAPCQQYWEASAVFIGTVIEDRLVTFKEGDRVRQMRAVRISIDEAFRGVEGAEVEVLTALSSAACGFGFRRTQQYLVYAFRSEADQKLHTSICTRTRAISEADADLVYIRGLSKAKPGGTISGQVFRYGRNDEGTLNNQPVAGVRVTIAGPEKYEAVTDEKGEFRIEGVQPGEYTVVPAPPKGLAVGGSDRKVAVSDRGCGTVSFWLRSSAQVSGRVLNPAGLPVKNAELSIILADKNQGRSDVAFADENGAYSFKMVPAGRYLIQMRYDGMSSQTRPFPVIYYPGTPYKSQARVFTIEEGETIELDVKVPPLPAEIEIRGQVVWPDGKPAAKARVIYLLPLEGIANSVEVDEEGRFSFKAYHGLAFVIGASVEVDKSKTVSGHSGPIVTGVNTQPIKIVLTSPSR
jgi:hypothetical protein